MTFNEWYDCIKKIPPIDLEWNPWGFPARGDRNRTGECADESGLLPILEYFASQCETITEFGCREGHSTSAFLVGLSKNNNSVRQKLISVDMRTTGGGYERLQQMNDLPCAWEFILRDTISGDWQINKTDMLHIDTLHTYDQVQKELEIHGNQAQKYLSFHDVISQGKQSLDMPGQEGICRAIEEYTNKNGWKRILEINYNHGLWIYGKTQ